MLSIIPKSIPAGHRHPRNQDALVRGQPCRAHLAAGFFLAVGKDAGAPRLTAELVLEKIFFHACAPVKRGSRVFTRGPRHHVIAKAIARRGKALTAPCHRHTMSSMVMS